MGFNSSYTKTWRAGGGSPLIPHPVSERMKNQGADAPRSPGPSHSAFVIFSGFRLLSVSSFRKCKAFWGDVT